MTSGVSGNWILLGKVLRPHGLEGLLRVRSYAQSEALFEGAGKVLLRSISGSIHAYRVLSARRHKNIVLMELGGVNSLEEAEELRDAEVLVMTEAIPREEGEYLWHELIGLRVFLDTGEHIGDISRIIDAGGNDIYVVGRGGKEIFVPATYEVVKDIDLEKGRMTISAMEGLLDLNEI
ncbi:MAG: rRNA processing protein RimM [Thermodesulfobacteriota bacterium]|nr:rRNA processing protein RimM [Thermodesulfobacteriota bacterium]